MHWRTEEPEDGFSVTIEFRRSKGGAILCDALSTSVSKQILAAASLPQLCSSAPPEVENFDPKCPEGMESAFVTDTFQYNLPAPIFFNRTASFFHSEWYTGPLLSSTGRDNTVGATRSGNFSGTLFTERLVEFSKTSDKVVHRFVLDNGPIRVGNLVIGSYTEGMEVLSICGGAATWFGFTDLLCANSGPGVFNLYKRARETLIGALADELGALIFEGTCPS